MTMMTIRIVSNSVLRTSWIALSMYFVRVEGDVPVSLWAALFDLFVDPRRTRPITSSALAFSRTHTPMKTAR